MVVELPGLGQRELAGRAVDQQDAEFVLQFAHIFRHQRFRTADRRAAAEKPSASTTSGIACIRVSVSKAARLPAKATNDPRSPYPACPQCRLRPAEPKARRRPAASQPALRSARRLPAQYRDLAFWRRRHARRHDHAVFIADGHHLLARMAGNLRHQLRPTRRVPSAPCPSARPCPKTARQLPPARRNWQASCPWRPRQRTDLGRIAGHAHVTGVGEPPAVQGVLLHGGDDILTVRARSTACARLSTRAIAAAPAC